MSNNNMIEVVKNEIESLMIKNNHEKDIKRKIELYEEELLLRKRYHYLLKKKRPLLLTFALVFCIFYGISLMICLPPYIIRGKKMDINEEKIIKIKQEIQCLEKSLMQKEEIVNKVEEEFIDIKEEQPINASNKNNTFDKLMELKQLYDQKMISKEEFEVMKNDLFK